MLKKSNDSLLGCIAFLFIILVVSIVVVISLCGGWIKHYSDGERSGVVVKLSKKGFIWKSWEGTMNLGAASVNNGGSMVPTVFVFSISDKEVAEKVQEASRSGERVTLRYTQWMVKPIRVDSGYDIAEVIPLTPMATPKPEKTPR